MIEEQVQFRISSELKNIIGRDLITDDFIAIYELVKNSYDANAQNVELNFKRIRDFTWRTTAKIFVKDDGDGMSYMDFHEKWLLVGYSRKRENEKTLESDDYRDKIIKKRALAGAKGIGRFSCDRLGSKLRLYSKRADENFFHCLTMDWDKFEQDPTKEFQSINVKYEQRETLNIEIDVTNFTKGTILEVSALREPWEREKLLKLKSQLQRLINPEAIVETEGFTIKLIAEEFIAEDKKYVDFFEKVNGEIKNILFEKLGIKTTHIKCTVDAEGEKITTELNDKSVFIYNIKEDNNYKPLHNVIINLFYLNVQAKTAFTKLMGLEPVNYGSVFFYKNGIKINPCGNFGDDWLGLDKRKTQGTKRYFGNRDVMGRIEVIGYQPNFKEVSSRDGGVVRTPEVELLIELFKEKVLIRLEKYVVEGINWDSETEPKSDEDIKVDTFKLVTKLVESAKESGQTISFNKDLLEIYSQKQIERTPEIMKNIESLKEHLNSEEAKDYLDLQAKSAVSSFRALKRKQRDLERDIKLKEQQALFLDRVAGEEKKEILAVQHQIGLGALLIRKYLLPLRGKIVRDERIPRDELLFAIENVLLQTQIMASMSREQFISKARFKLSSEEINEDLSLYIQQYIERVYIPFNNKELDEKQVTIKVNRPENVVFKRIFDAMKIVVIIDNLISNSTKAKSKNIEISISCPDERFLEIRFRDDGIGISDNDLKNIFKFGYTTTGGNGIGLYHIKKIMAEYGSIKVNNHLEKGVEFLLRVNKN
ncbi:MAG: ATP-binding protein [Candidatus Bathyarchaeota archaeon]|nr:ATP-binding protein [Candidatus Bathyarchaeota archaeon]